MPAKTGSRNGLSYGWALGENNWNTGMDGNLTFIDRFGVHLSFKSFLNTPPGSPAAGDCHVIDTVPTGVWVGKAGQVAVYDDGAWRYGVPRTGWRAYCEADERLYVYDGGWAPTAIEWSADTVPQAEAEAGTATTRRAWTAQRVRQAIAAWWNGVKGALVGPIGINGDLEFTGTASRITGDFSNATLANRLMFQSSTVDTPSHVGAIPNGLVSNSSFTAYQNSDPDNASYLQTFVNATTARIASGKTGSGTYKPLVLNVGGADVVTYSEGAATLGNMTASVSRDSLLAYTISNTNAGASARSALTLHSNAGSLALSKFSTAGGLTGGAGIINTGGAGLFLGTSDGSPAYIMTNNAFAVAVNSDGDLLLRKATGVLGYGAGAGGTVTQTTSKSTDVTLNKPAGRITMNAASLAAGTAVVFTLNNTRITPSTIVTVNAVNNAAYRVETDSVFNGVAQIRVFNRTGGALAEALMLNFIATQISTT